MTTGTEISPPKLYSVRMTLFVAAVFMLCSLGLILILARPGDNRLVVYCAHDSIFSEQILNAFEEQTGIKVDVQFDTEATKSLGLVNRLIQERDHPQCDVFWNNELLGTLALQEEGLLQAYRGTGFERIPEQFKDPSGEWVGFAGRLRVFIINTERFPDVDSWPGSKLDQPDLSRFAMAKPIYGTTLTHAALLWKKNGPEGFKKFFKDYQQRGMKIVAGNAVVKNLVASGSCDFGFTDTDDFNLAQEADSPVVAVPVTIDGKYICIPNTVAIIKGTKRSKQAQQLVDFLLSSETEKRLANSPSRQVPLGDMKDQHLPDDVLVYRTWSKQAHDLRGLLPVRNACLAWLKQQDL